MNFLRIVLKMLLCLVLVVGVFAQANKDILQFKAKIGFTQAEDKIVEYKFLENGKKVLLVGQKNIQLWDVEAAKLLNSVPHQIPQFSSSGFLSFVTLGLSDILKWKPFVIYADGKRLVTIEKIGNKKIKSAVVRGLQTAKQIAILNMPSFSTDYVAFVERKNEITTFGKTDKNAEFTIWDGETLQSKKTFSVKDYGWHQLLENGEKIVVGSGNTKINWNGGSKDGNSLTLRDGKTGAIEKEFTAKDLVPDATFQKTKVSKDEKFLISTQSGRIFVWEIGGNGLPKFEISSNNPKEKIELLQITSDGRYLVVSNDIKISVFEVAGDVTPKFEIAPQNEQEKIRFVSIMENEEYVAANRNRNKSEFYDLETGKLFFEMPTSFNYVRFTPDKKFLYDVDTGRAYFWNIEEKKSTRISLKTYQPGSNPEEMMETERNIEYLSLSPNGKFALKHGENLVTLFNIETGQEIQSIFDSQKVKYDKQNKIKDSGYDEADWTADGKYVYAFDANAFSGKRRTISFWSVSN